MTVLQVAYPLAPVGPDACGGAEQVLAALDEGLTRAGHRSLVVACAGSVTAGELLPAGDGGQAGPFDEAARRRAQERHRAAVAQALRRHPVDLVHMHGIDFFHYLPAADVPVLVTLHLPPSWYPAEIFAGGPGGRSARPRTYLSCVSAAQRRACPAGARLVADIENGVPLRRLAYREEKRPFALALGRICPEKGFALALDACHRAGVPLLLCGQVFPYPEHVAYFQSEILPRLDARRRFIGPVGGARKRRLLAAARCLLVPSLAPETSSLVAMEALASGTPVIAFPAGALPEIVEHGRTGFLVRSVAEMAAAIHQVSAIPPAACRRAAVRRFSAARMVRQYVWLYEQILQRRR